MKNRNAEQHQPSRDETAGNRDMSQRFQTGGVTMISAGHGIHDTYTAFLPPLLPLFISSLSLSKAQAGLLTVFTQAPSLLNPVIGHWADTSHHRRWIFFAPAVTAASMSLLGEAGSYGMLTLLLLISGLSTAAFHAVGPVIAGRLSGRYLGKGMSFWMFGGELGRALGPIIVVTAIRVVSLDGVPWLMVLGVIASVILFIRVQEGDAHIPNRPQAFSWRQAIRQMRPVMVPVVGLIVIRAFMFASLTIFLPVFLTEEGESLWLAGTALTIVQTAGAMGAFMGGTLSDRLGRRSVLFVGILVTPLLLFVFLGAGGWIRFLLLSAMGLMLISTTPVIMAVVQENFPDNRALASGTYLCLSFSIRSAIIVVVGALGDWLGLRLAFIISSVIMLLGLPLVFLLPKDPARVMVGEKRWRIWSPPDV